MNTDITIRLATTADAQVIANAIMEAVGYEITLDFAGTPERLPLVRQVFTELASMTDSQYSHLNTLIAQNADGQPVGVAIAYDGALLHPLRGRFVETANRILGTDIKEEEMSDETSDDEIYLDTLCVFSPWRRRGIASMLIEATALRHESSGKPLGLLVDKENYTAQALYAKNGLHYVGDRPFAGVMMNHLQRP